MLTATGISKSFAGRQVLHDINVSVAPGQITCVIGPSGTGKTTLLRALAMLDVPDTGEISIDGKVTHFPLPQGAAVVPPWPQVTVVFQSLFLWPHLTLRENIMLPARNRNSFAEEEIDGLIRLFDMRGFIDRYPNEASIGQRQRVALARALILRPRYILLDEITSALDVEQTAHILGELARLKERGIGIFLITHHLAFARKAADQIIFMAGGRIDEQGSVACLSQPKSERFKKFLDLAEQVG